MSCYIDLVDISQYVENMEGRGFKQNLKAHDLSLKPGSLISGGQPAGYEFSLYGSLWADTRTALRALIDTFQTYFRPRDYPYRIDFNGNIHYAHVVDIVIREDERYKLAKWEAHFISEEPVPVGGYSALTLVQDTAEDFMNSGPGITMPVFYKVTSGSSIAFEMSDIDGAEVARLGSTLTAPTAHTYGTLAHEYEYKLTDAIRCQKWTSGTGHSGAEGGMYWSPSSTDLSAENCYTVWVAVLVDKDLISSARIGLGDGTDIGWVTVTDRISDGVWSWIPVFVREAEKANASYGSSATTRVYLAFTPNTAASIDVYVDGHVIVRNPAKITLATTSYAGPYDMRTGKFLNAATGQDVNPTLTIQGKPWVRPGCNLFYQNSSATDQYAYVRGAK